MNKKLLMIIAFLCCIFTAVGCGDEASGNLGKDEEKLAGTWNGIGNAIGRDNGYSCGSLSFSIERDGSFSLKDVAQNTTCLAGTFQAGSRSTLALGTEEGTVADLPTGWDSLTAGSEFSYTMPTSNALVLTYKNISYFFEKEKDGHSKTAGSSNASLLNLTENDVWYSQKGAVGNQPAFELTLYDKYMELNAVDPRASTEGERIFLMNFFYLSSRENTFTFYTLKNSGSDIELPDFLTDLPEGFSTVKMTMTAENNTITLSYGGQDLKLYNNVKYNEKFHSAEKKKTKNKNKKKKTTNKDEA